MEDNAVKIPLAYVLDHLGFRGRRRGDVGLHENQPIVLINFRGATSEQIDLFAREVEQEVFEKTNVRIEREVKHFPSFRSK